MMFARRRKESCVRSALLSWPLSVSIATRSTLKMINKHSPVFFKDEDEMEGQGLKSCILCSTLWVKLGY